jgi:hypothetical protein
MSLQWQHWQRAPASLSSRLTVLGARFEVQRLSQRVQPRNPREGVAEGGCVRCRQFLGTDLFPFDRSTSVYCTLAVTAMSKPMKG